MWLRDGGRTRDVDTLYRAYLADFASRDVRWIDFGVFLCAQPADGVAAVQEVSDTVGRAAPEGVWELFAVRRALARATDLAKRRIIAADDVTLEHHYRVGDSQPELITATQGGGLHEVVACPTEMAGLLSAADGSLTVGQIAGALAALLEVPEDDMRAACLAHARRLASCGMVTLPER